MCARGPSEGCDVGPRVCAGAGSAVLFAQRFVGGALIAHLLCVVRVVIYGDGAVAVAVCILISVSAARKVEKGRKSGLLRHCIPSICSMSSCAGVGIQRRQTNLIIHSFHFVQSFIYYIYVMCKCLLQTCAVDVHFDFRPNAHCLFMRGLAF